MWEDQDQTMDQSEGEVLYVVQTGRSVGIEVDFGRNRVVGVTRGTRWEWMKFRSKVQYRSQLENSCIYMCTVKDEILEAVEVQRESQEGSRRSQTCQTTEDRQKNWSKEERVESLNQVRQRRRTLRGTENEGTAAVCLSKGQ